MLTELIFGKLTLDAIPFYSTLIMTAGGFMVLVALGSVLAITYLKKWSYIWHEWITSVDHKKIGVMYLLLSTLMFLRGFSDAILMRSQQALAAGNSLGYLPADHYSQIFSAHGVIMIFFVAMPMMFGLINIVLPLQIGARDVAYPYLNSLSFWIFFFG